MLHITAQTASTEIPSKHGRDARAISSQSYPTWKFRSKVQILSTVLMLNRCEDHIIERDRNIKIVMHMCTVFISNTHFFNTYFFSSPNDSSQKRMKLYDSLASLKHLGVFGCKKQSHTVTVVLNMDVYLTIDVWLSSKSALF